MLIKWFMKIFDNMLLIVNVNESFRKDGSENTGVKDTEISTLRTN